MKTKGQIKLNISLSSPPFPNFVASSPYFIGKGRHILLVYVAMGCQKCERDLQISVKAQAGQL